MGVVDDTQIAFCRSATLLSLVCCISIVISVLVFRKELWKRYYIRLIFFVVASDLVAVFPFSFGPVHNGEAICYIQATFTNFFSMASVLWTSFIVYILYDVVVRRHSLEGIYFQSHVICWGIPFITTFLPLTTDKYGVYDGEEKGYCGIIQKSNAEEWTSQFWNVLFDVILVFSLFFTATLLYLIYSSLHQQDPQFIGAYIDMAVRKLKYYPIIIIICWSIQLYLDIVVIYFSDDLSLTPSWLLIMSDTLICLQGSLTTWAFWVENREIRLMWYMLYRNYMKLLFIEDKDGNGVEKEASLLRETEADINEYREQWACSQSDGNSLLSNRSEQGDMLREKLFSVSSSGSKSNRATVSDYDVTRKISGISGPWARDDRDNTITHSPLQGPSTSLNEA